LGTSFFQAHLPRTGLFFPNFRPKNTIQVKKKNETKMENTQGFFTKIKKLLYLTADETIATFNIVYKNENPIVHYWENPIVS